MPLTSSRSSTISVLSTRRMVTASWRATSAVVCPGASVVVVVLVLVVVVVVLVDVEVDVVVVDVVGGPGAHVGVPVGSGGSPLSMAHVTVTVPPGTYWTTTRSPFGTPRLLGPRRWGRSSRVVMRRSSASPGLVAVVVPGIAVVVGGTASAVVGLVDAAAGAAVVMGVEVRGADWGGSHSG